MNFFLDRTKNILGLKLKKKIGPRIFFLGLIKSGALGECLTRLGFEPALSRWMSKLVFPLWIAASVELGEYGLGELGEFMPLWCFLQHTGRRTLLRMVGMIGETPPEISLWPNRSINLVVFFLLLLLSKYVFDVGQSEENSFSSLLSACATSVFYCCWIWFWVYTEWSSLESINACLGPGANYTYRVLYAKQLGKSEAALYMDITYINGDEWLLYHQNILSVPDLDRDKEDIQTD
jgi:hypothetical protein